MIFVALVLLLALPAHGATEPPIVVLPACSDSAAPDSDEDGLGDECELALARSFAPLLVVRSGGCNWDPSLNDGQPGGGWFHAVQPVDSIVRIAYLPAYFRDCGWQGLKCRVPFLNCAPHDGDSELVVVEVKPLPEPDSWQATAVFLSAHCFGRRATSCRWYRDQDLQRIEWRGSSPVVWVAEGRNANYVSQRHCDRGYYFVDTCDRHDFHFQFPVHPDRNLGSRAAPAHADGCVAGARLGLSGDRAQAEECFWRSDRPFRGWHPRSPGVTPYDRYFREIVGI